MRRCGRERTLDVGSTVTDATDDTRRPSGLILTDQRAPPSSSWTQQRRRRSTGTRQQLMGCVSGQRSPMTPTTAVTLPGVGESAVCSSRPPIDPAAPVRERHSPRPSKCYRPALSVYCDQVVLGNSTLVSAAAAAAAAAAEAAESSSNSAGDSGVDVNSSWSFEKEEVDRRRPSASGRGRSRSAKTMFQFTAGHSAPLSTRQVTGDPSVEQLEPEMGSKLKRDRKSRSQSPAALWRSISSSSLMRSLSRRRAASKSQHGITSGITAAGSHVETAASRSKSLDTDSDSENRDAATEQARRRRIRGGSSSGSGGSVTGLGLETGDSRRRIESIAAGGGETRRRRSGIFGGARSFRQTQTTATDDIAVSQSATLHRRQRCNDGRGGERSDSPGPSKLSSRAASWASLRRSQTSESLSLMKTQSLLLSNGFNLVTTLKLSEFMVGKWISGMAITDKHELVVVDLRAAYLVDSVSGRLIRVVGGSGRGGAAGRLSEPIGAATAADGRLVFSDRADQTAKLYSARGQHVRTVTGLGLSNVGGVAVARSTGNVYVAGSDCHGVALVRGAAASGAGRADTVVDIEYLSDFEHPYSVAVNCTTGDVIVGDDYRQMVTCLTADGRTVKWRWCPPSNSGDQRPFFPSAISVDCTSGRVFIADLYNEKVYWMESEGRCCCEGAVLTRGAGLRGGPAAIAVDGVRRLLYVADEERTVHVFSYSAADQQPAVSFSTFYRQGSADEVFC